MYLTVKVLRLDILLEVWSGVFLFTSFGEVRLCLYVYDMITCEGFQDVYCDLTVHLYVCV